MREAYQRLLLRAIFPHDILNSGKYCAIFFGFPNSLLDGSGVSGEGGTGPSRVGGSAVTSDVLFFLMLPWTGAVTARDTTGADVTERMSNAAGPSTLVMTVRPLAVTGDSGVRDRDTPKGTTGTSERFSGSTSPAVPRGVVAWREGRFFSFVARPLVCTKAEDRTWYGLRW
jgi:hypothetical protein